MSFHYYQTNNGEITAMSETARSGFTYSEEELVIDYQGRIVPLSKTQTDDYHERRSEYEKEKQKEDLRYRRKSECFTIINRGQLWYERLTETQKHQLDEWYSAWLDVTETLTVPEKPSWIN